LAGTPRAGQSASAVAKASDSASSGPGDIAGARRQERHQLAVAAARRRSAATAACASGGDAQGAPISHTGRTSTRAVAGAGAAGRPRTSPCRDPAR
jgi:hypothetical protein